MERIDLEYWRAERAKKARKLAEIEEAKLKKSRTPPPKKETIPIEVIKKSNVESFMFNVKHIGSKHLFVGIPGDTPTALHRRQQIQKRINRFTGKSAKSLATKKSLKKLKKASVLSNAYLLSIFERGSPLRQQPPRPLFKPVLMDNRANRKTISDMLASSSKALANGDEAESVRYLKLAGDFAVKALKGFFEMNNWPKNAPSTVSKKGFDKPGVWSDSMRSSITYQLKEYKDKKTNTGRMEKIT